MSQRQWPDEVTGLRDAFINAIADRLDESFATQVEAAEHLGTTQSRVSMLSQRKAEEFSLDTLVTYADRLDIQLRYTFYSKRKDLEYAG